MDEPDPCDYEDTTLSLGASSDSRTDSSVQPYVCKFPGCRFSAVKLLYLQKHQKCHMNQVNKVKSQVKVRQNQRPVKCNQCDYLATHPCTLKVHMKVHSEEKPFSCDVPGCDYETRWEHSLASHRKLLHEDENTVWYKCEKCDFRTKYKYVLEKRHSRLHAEVSVPKKFKCNLCHYTAHSRDKLEDHIKKHTGEKKPIPCDIPGCEFICNSKSSAYKHKQVVHWEKTWYKCDQCSYQIWHKAGLTTHMKMHVDRKSFRCTFEDCEYRAKTRGSLYSHMNRHDYKPSEVPAYADGSQNQGSEMALNVARNLKRYPCTHPECHYVAKERKDLSNHLQTHDPNRTKSIKCLLCPKLFFTEDSRRAHLMIHTNEKPFKCSFPGCDHRTYHLSDLKKHEHIHQTLKPFVCDFSGCQYSATCKDYLRKHSETHKTDRAQKFRCNLCPRGFYTRCGLKNHVFSHTTEKPFECPTCGYTCVYRNLYNKHSCPDKFKETQRRASQNTAKVISTTVQLREDGMYQCNFCGFAAKAFRSAVAHAGSAHTRKQEGKPWNRPKTTD